MNQAPGGHIRRQVLPVTLPDINTVATEEMIQVKSLGQSQPHEEGFLELLVVTNCPPIEPHVVAGVDAIDVVNRPAHRAPPLAAEGRVSAAAEAKPLAFLPRD